MAYFRVFVFVGGEIKGNLYRSRQDQLRDSLRRGQIEKKHQNV